MKKTILSSLMLAMIFVSCQKPTQNIVTQDTSSDKSETTSVKAEDGGVGFEKVAQSLGFETNAGEDYSNPNAVKGGTYHGYFGAYTGIMRPYGPEVHTDYVIQVVRLIYGMPQLIKYNERTDKWERGLADYWKFENDGQRLTVRINPNAKFSDGTPFTTNDVIDTYNLAMSDELGDPMSKRAIEKYHFTKLSDYLLQIDVDTKEWAIWINFSLYFLPSSYLSKVDPKTYLQKYANEPMPGLGPYVFDKENSKDQELIVLKKNPNWWGYTYPENKNTYNFDVIDYKIILDEKSQRENFKAGNFDVIEPSSIDWYGDYYKKTPTFDPIARNLVVKKVVFNDIGGRDKGGRFFVFNLKKKPFDDLNLRKAMELGFNKDIIIEKIYHNDFIKYFSKFMLTKWESPNIEKLQYNPEEANRLLDEAGYSERDEDGIRKNANGQRLEFEVYFYQRFEQLHTMFQEDMKAIGIKIDLQKTEFQNIIKKLNERDFNIVLIGFGGTGIPRPEMELLSSLADENNNWNMSGYKNPKVDELINLYLTEKDVSKRYEWAHQIDDIISRDHIYLHTWTTPFTERIVYWNKFGTAGAPDGEDKERYWYIDPEKEKQLKEAMTDTAKVLPEGDLIVDRQNSKPADFVITDY